MRCDNAAVPHKCAARLPVVAVYTLLIAMLYVFTLGSASSALAEHKGNGFSSILANKKVLSINGQKKSNVNENSVHPSVDGALVKKIDVTGNVRIATDAVVAHSGIRVGKKYDQGALNNVVKSLYSTGFFDRVYVTYDNKSSTINVSVTENPTIDEVAFEGNDKFSDKELRNIVKLRSGSVYSLAAVDSDVRRLVAFYQHAGFFAVVVKPKIVKMRNNRVGLAYIVDEERKTKISKIIFSGNDDFTDADLRKVIESTERSWFHFLGTRGLYERERIEVDKNNLNQFYQAMGYADFKVVDVISEMSPQQDSFVMTFVLYEGKKYKVNKVAVQVGSGLYGVTSSDIMTHLSTHNGAMYNKDMLDSDIEYIKRYLGKRGYAFANTSYSVTKDTAHSTANVEFYVSEGAKFYVNKININDNVRTLDSVIRREMKLREGDSFNYDLMEASQRAIERLGFFSEVSVSPNETNVPDKLDIDVTVKERPTGSLNLAGGYETGNGPMVNFAVSENNLVGTGNTMSFDARKDRNKTNLTLGFSKPYFDDRNLLIGGDLFFHDEIMRSSGSTEGEGKDEDKVFHQKSVGADVYALYPWTLFLKHQLQYTLKHEVVSMYNAKTSPLIKSSAGKYFVSTVGQAFIYDRRNSIFSPSEGYYINFSQNVDGIGGKVKNFKNVLEASYYYPLYKHSVVLQLSGGAGGVIGYSGDIVRINHNFYMGMDDVRGFDLQGIGPRDKATGDAIGGKYYYKMSAEVRFPIGLPRELGVKGATFVDAASLFGVDVPKSLKDTYPQPQCTGPYDKGKGGSSSCLYWGKHKLRSSYGLGVLWDSPLGSVIRLDYGWVMSKADFDYTSGFRLSFTQQF